MKKHIYLALTLFLAVGTVDVSSQSFLKKLEKTVKKEVENRVNNEVKRGVNKGMDKGIDAVTGEQQQNQTKTQQSRSRTSRPRTSRSYSSSSNSSRSNSSQGQSVPESFYSDMGKRAPITTIATMVEYGATAGKLNGHEWVDLGLPSGTRWATCNVDATLPHQPGKLYSWGETATKTSYVGGNTKTYNKEMANIAGNKNYDVATLKWGKGWRIPTEENMRELLQYCTDKYVQKGGRWGREFTSVLNNKSIFLPATGSKDGTKLSEANGCGLYWSSTPYTDKVNTGAHMYTFGAALGEMSIAERYYGLAIRPVMDYDVNTDIPYDGETNGHKWVDLALPSGLKWATCNVGSNAVDQDGDYYKWGGTTTYHHNGSRGQGNYAKESEINEDISGNVRYDAARLNWGEPWCMPNAYDFIELMENCTWEWTNIGRRKGLKVTSKINGKYIFLPASGECNYTTDRNRLPIDINKKICYWTSTPYPGTQAKGDAYQFTILANKEVMLRSAFRSHTGWCIRPVIK